MKSLYDCVVHGDPIETLYIDVHGHFGPSHGVTIPYAMDRQRIIAAMDRYGCDMVWMSACRPGHSDDVAIRNDYVFDFADEYPDRIIPWCTLSANCPERAVTELKRCLARGRCIGVKMHVYCQPPYTMRSDFMQPILEILAEHRLLYINHIFTDMDALAWALEKYPDVVFISGHMNPLANDLARDHANMFDCTCAAIAPHEVQNEVERLRHSDSMLVGSDFAGFHLGFGVGMLAYADMDEQHKRNILGLNALTLLKRTSWFMDLAFSKPSSPGPPA